MADNVSKKPLPPPFIFVPTLENLRDVGGLPITTSTPNASSSIPKAVRKRIIYRSADPTFLSIESIQYLRQELGITKIFDLRSEPEFVKQGTAVEEFDQRIAEYNRANTGRTIERHWTPVFATQDYSPESIAIRFQDYGAEDSAEGFTRAYSEILKHGGRSYRRILQTLAFLNLSSTSASGDKGVLLHCTAGKDRTGVLIALILSLLNVPREKICAEYELTETGLAEQRKGFVERILTSGAFDGKDPGVGIQAALRMTGAKAESMQRTLEYVDREYGGAEGYVKKVCGLGDNAIEALRQNLTVEDVENVNKKDAIGTELRGVL